MIHGTRRQLQTSGAIVLMALLAACSGGGRREEPAAVTRSSTVQSEGETRSERGNPPFYNVLGKRYHVLPTSAGYRARGTASWYGPDFHGLATSSGERYDMNAMTAAHTTLPLPTWVEVTNLENGRSVVVKVNDRGPFVANRIIDLSYAAATQLDMVRNGTARVEVRAMAAPYAQPIIAAAPPVTPAPAPVATPPPSAAPPVVAARPVIVPGAPGAPGPITASVLGLPSLTSSAPPAASRSRMFVQAGAFSERENAVRLVARLTADGFVNPFIVTDGHGARALHRVRLGPIGDSAEFDRVKSRLLAAGVANPQLVVDR
ncbi:MAG: septal ring lytic transglycosylase RlpA family protein [Gammaproteobacteria bacterium]